MTITYFEVLIDWIKANKPNKAQIHEKKVELCKSLGRKIVPTDIEVYMNANHTDLPLIQKYLQTKPTRTSSGVTVVATMSAPGLCPHGACTFCPGGLGSFYGDTPMSYTGNEPSTMRAMRNEYDPYRIIFNRLQQYIILGQHPDKVEQIIQGGTFPSYSKQYQEDYCYYSFKAYNDFSKEFFARNAESGEWEFLLEKFKAFFELPCAVGDKQRHERIKEKILAIKSQNKKTLEDEQVENETTAIRCIGLTIETKPDWGFGEHGLDFLRLGATRVELGVQTVYDDILQAVNRGHTIQDTWKSVRELRDLAFKLNFHLMPGLPTPQGPKISKERDIESIRQIFQDNHYKPDMIKIYPCMVMPGTPLEKEWKDGKFSPITTQEAGEVIVEAFRYVEPWCRIMRIQRDIPTWATTAGVDRTNLRQYVDEIAAQRGIKSRDIRAREPRTNAYSGEPHIVVNEFEAGDGREFFISMEAKNENGTDDCLLGFVRLRFPSQCLHPAITPTSGLIRELHVYGAAVPIGVSDDGKVQHRGFGRQLMAKAEEIAKEHGRDKIIVISGVGVRDYYRKIGYEREGPYMVKKI